MSAEKRTKNWILVTLVFIVALIVPIIKFSNGEPAINQGIDLKGGVDMLLQAQFPEGMEEDVSDLMLGAINIIRHRLDPEGIKEITIQKVGDDRIVIQIPGEDDPERVKILIGATATLRFIDAGNDPIREGTRIRFIDPETGEEVNLFGGPAGQAVGQETQSLGGDPEEDLVPSVVTAELLFRSDQIDSMYFLPGEGDETEAELAVDLVFEAGLQLTVHTTQNEGQYIALLVDSAIQSVTEITGSLTGNQITFAGLAGDPERDFTWYSENRDRIEIVAIAEDPPEVGTVVEVFDPQSGMGQLLGGEPPEEEAEGEEEAEQIVIDITTDKIILTGDDFADASVDFDQASRPQIAFEFKPKGKDIFARHTASHVQQYLAIALDDIIISCPIIQEPILSGRGVISGSFSVQDARDLVIKLDSGRLPIPLNIIENRTVSPTLGVKSIDESKRAAVLGAILILLFMAAYYRLPGLMADIALIFYIVVFFGALSILNATLTLPGIAGFILTVGMAVDANVIIFERLKEELKTGKTFRSATDAAFKRAFLAIFDANVTTLITALVLYNLGTGPIRGFAVTLSLGILVSMFTALVFTRLLIETILNFRSLHKYSLFGIREQDVATGTKGGKAR